MDANNHNDDFNPTTNWKLAGGTLTNSISLESSFTTNHESESSTVDNITKSPLLLLPPIPKDEPCEITITYEQEHELRQIYIRSSARVYEVYYKKKQRNDKEYLCTVRCGIAIREEGVFQIPLVESDASKNRVKEVKDSIEKRVKDNGSGWTNEDDWVEVNNEKDSLPMLQLGKQDFYEATAEINDVEPCISITVRLLSLQDKRCAIVDEVYIFADSVDPSETEPEEASVIGNSSSSSLMAMFMPALLQLSRGKDVRKERDRQVSEQSNCTNSGDNIVNEIQQDTNFSKADHIGASSPVLVDTLAKPVDATTGVSGTEIKPATVSCNNVETILDQLVNKVSRIETILMRFEDQMLKPINSIDARLQLVEKKLEQLEKKLFESELVSETKVLNPDSLGGDTDETPDTDELDGLTKNTDDQRLTSCTKIVVPDSSSKNNSEDCAVVVPKFTELESENYAISGNENISAESEISNEEVGDSLGRRSFEEKPKRSVSINDALASALAGLLSSHSITDGKYRQALVVTAPEFSDEDDDMEIKEKPRIGAKEELENTDSTSESSTSSQKEPGVTAPCIKDDSHEMINGVSEKLDDSFGGGEETETVFSFWSNDVDEEEMVTSSTKADCYTEKELDPVYSDSVHELENPNVTTAKCKGETEMDDVLKSVLGFQRTTSVDFLTPVLDVKFDSENKDSDSKCFFEALFTAESKTLVDCNNEAFDDNFVSVEDEELKGPPTDTLSSLEMDHYETNDIDLHLNANISEASLI